MLKGELERFIVLRDLKGLSVSSYYNYARLVSLCLIDTTIFVLLGEPYKSQEMYSKDKINILTI